MYRLSVVVSPTYARLVRSAEFVAVMSKSVNTSYTSDQVKAAFKVHTHDPKANQCSGSSAMIT